MNTLRSLYWESTRAVRFITIIVCLLGVIGIYVRRNGSGGDLSLAMHLYPWWVWCLGLLSVAIHRYWCLWRSAICHTDCLETIPGATACVLSIFIWAVFLTSAAVSTDFGLALMLLVCIFIEMWLLSRHAQQLIFKRGVKK